MEENNNNNLKTETKDAVNEVKNAFKGTNFKNESENLKGFLLNFIKAPLTTVKSISSGEKNGIVTAVILLVALIIFSVLGDVIYYGMTEYLEVTTKMVILDIISPIIFVAVFSMVTYFLGGKEKKDITTIVSSIMIAFTPYVLKSIIYILYALINEVLSIYFIYNMISLTITFITMILLMNTIKELITKVDNEEQEFKKIILIVFISYVILCILGKLEFYSAF